MLSTPSSKTGDLEGFLQTMATLQYTRKIWKSYTYLSSCQNPRMDADKPKLGGRIPIIDQQQQESWINTAENRYGRTTMWMDSNGKHTIHGASGKLAKVLVIFSFCGSLDTLFCRTYPSAPECGKLQTKKPSLTSGVSSLAIPFHGYRSSIS